MRNRNSSRKSLRRNDRARRANGSRLARVFAGLGALVLAACAVKAPEETGPIFYPPLPQLPKVQFLTTIAEERDLGEGDSAFRDYLLGLPEQTARLAKPWDVAHGKGKIYVVDTTYQNLVIIDLAEGRFDTIRDTKGGAMSDPRGVFVTGDGYKYVADKGRRQVLVYNDRNEFFRAYGSEGQFEPHDVVVHGNRVYVVDLAEHEIEVLDRDSGEVVAKFGEVGKEEGQLFSPTHLALGPGGEVFVTDFMNFRLQEFDADGEFIRVIGELGTFPGATPRPKGIAVDHDGHLYAVDAAFELVQIFDSETGNVLLGFGKYGGEPGATYLPSGVDVDYDNLAYFAKYVDPNFSAKYLVYVVNQAGPRKLNVYAFGDWTGPTPAGALPPQPTEPEGQ